MITKYKIFDLNGESSFKFIESIVFEDINTNSKFELLKNIASRNTHLVSNPDFMDLGKWVLKFFDLQLAEIYLKTQNDLYLKMLFDIHISQLLASLSLNDGDLVLYSEEELIEIINGNTKVNSIRLYYTLSQISGIDKYFHYKAALFSYLEKHDFVLNYDYNLNEIFTLALVLKACWNWFSSLDEIEKRCLFNKYFYISLMFELPVKEILSNYFYTSCDAVHYLKESKIIIDFLSQNIEKVILNSSPIRLEEIYLNNKSNSSSELENILKAFGNFYFTKQIIIAFQIRDQIKSLKLIDHLFVDEKNDSYKLMRDSYVLLFSFVLGNVPGGWDFIVKYYQDGGKNYSISNLLNDVSIYDDLKNEIRLNFVLEFIEYLKKNQLLNKDVALLIFDEQQNKFVWNLDQLGKVNI